MQRPHSQPQDSGKMGTAQYVNGNGDAGGVEASYGSKRSSGSAAEKSLVGGFRWMDVLIPDDAGQGTTKVYYQYRFIAQYATVYLLGIFINQTAQSPALRAASIGFLFPGAGLTAVGSIPSLVAFVLSICLIPVVLFIWFGCGGVFFPILLWAGTVPLAAALAKDTLLEEATPFWAVACIVGISFMVIQSKRGRTAANEKRVERNGYLMEAVQENQANAAAIPEPGSRELDLRTLRFLQWWVECGLLPFDDWSYHDIIDQFQTSALRYQLYEVVYVLSLYTCHYAPGYHGAVTEACVNAIYKSTTKKVMNYWKWECLFGKFNGHDWNPVKKDNIMVTGYILQAIALYDSNTGDHQFRKKDCLEFVVTDKAKYKSDLYALAESVFDNMDNNPYTLYPCEPNWLYTPCNLIGIGGSVVSDRILGTDFAERIRSRFHKAIELEFTEPDGSLLPIRSELIGFTIPGICGVLSDCTNSMLCAAYLPSIAHRNWAMSRKESVRYDHNDELVFTNLKGADRLDPGNYKTGDGYLRAVFASSAAEYGDLKIKKDCLDQLDNKFFPVQTLPSGSYKNKGLSTWTQGTAMRARLMGNQDWTTMATKGPSPNALKGPLLVKTPFPDILVAKAYSHDGFGLDLVMYDGKAPGKFELGFERLTPGGVYNLSNGEKMTSDALGKATIAVSVKGRTAIMITPA